MIVKCGAYRFFNGNRVGGIQKRRELGKARKLLREMQKKKPVVIIVKIVM